MSTNEPPPRPTKLEELRFKRRSPVQWFSPPTLARAAAKVILAAAFGDYLDKREMQGTLAATMFAIDPDADDLWFDFVADTGDGFNSTYSVAWCMARKEIEFEVDGRTETLKRAKLVVLGGDEVYPYATPKEYQDRFEGPMQAALPWTEGDSTAPPTERCPPSFPDLERPEAPANPTLLAIPGNHDWYDGLTGFMRLFAQRGWVGGRQLIQQRSYFAVKLPGRYWLWGIDIQNDSYVDAAQLSYFETAAARMAADDRLIICTGKPSWIDVGEDPDAYRNLKKVESLVPKTVRVVLMLSGDSHHYARYESQQADANGSHRMKITAGGGGAFLSATHNLDDHVRVPRRVALGDSVTADERFDLKTLYPSAKQSRLLSLRAFLLPVRNWTFMPIPGMFYLLLFIASNSRLTADENKAPTETLSNKPGFLDLVATFLNGSTPLLIVVLFAMISGFYVIPKRVGVWPARFFRTVLGLLQASVHLAAQAWFAMILLRFRPENHDRIFLLCGSSLMFVFGAVVGSLIFAFFLWALFYVDNWNDTETFSAFRHTGYKNFLRMHVTKEEITVYAIGVEKISHRWDITKKQSDEDSWLCPKNSPDIPMRLLEPPYRVS
jgi:hypothetical protein